MAENPHYRELLQALNDYEVEYLVVGGYAVMKYIQNHDIRKTSTCGSTTPKQNSARLFRALAKFGAPLKPDGVTPETFTERKIVYQIGVAPVRIDILTHIDGVEFTSAWRNRVTGVFFGISVYLISLDDLIANKQAAGRDSDLEHLQHIQKETRKKK